ncbi:MAG: DUF2851 family protein [Saprospiraceae bacterium]|nr:DUF2851 family protein [Saprospiraceae bacterium]
MQESFLHYLWRTRRFDAHNLRCTQGQLLEILHTGTHNNHAGPDFFDARIRLDDTLWAGNIEMHLSSSEWRQHKHSDDPAYDNVVLHVVLKEDQPVFRSNGERIPCLELRERIPPRLLENYRRLEREQAWIPCQYAFQNAPEIVRLNWFDRLLVERLEQKTEAIAAALSATENHWEEAFYRLLARNFGLKINAEPFDALARTLPLRILAKHRSNLMQMEALLLGQAGLLQGDFTDEWPRFLKREYRHLANKYELTPLEAGQWKFLRMRPANFPTIRIVQFAALMHRSVHLFSSVLEAQNLRELEHLFQISPGEYWESHFLPDKPSVKSAKHLGRDFVRLLFINTVVPFLFHYGKTKQADIYQKRALALLESLPGENNALLDGWAALGVPSKHAYQTQALIQLKTRYCDAKRCLECAIGHAILK